MFIFNANTSIKYNLSTPPVLNAVKILRRDMNRVFTKSDCISNQIILQEAAELEAETWQLLVEKDITIKASDDLGFVYALLFLSERFLHIKPFWFWMNQKIEKIDKTEIKEGIYQSPKYAVRYRGWFFNDEVLLMKWNICGDSVEPWRMAYEALLRCGGNMAIPATDKNGIKNRRLASDMGLWITHHHAEPLGAEMFTRAYPGKNPNYTENKELFIRLWEEAVLEQKDKKVIYALGFRGQGDCPFWSHDSSGAYNTNEKRGALISDLIELQKSIIKKHVDRPVFCTNLYGEIMELYKEGHIRLSEDIIKIYADNGYGKMVTRRRDNHCARVEALPQADEAEGQNGIYYHVSFYDLQAANHITMFPNSIGFMNQELNRVLERGAKDYWIINCSNVRPHTYFLDALRKKWMGQELSDKTHSMEFAADYFSGNPDIAWCYENYAKAVPAYGKAEDEHAGEQFYNENVRLLMNHLIAHREGNIKSLIWLTGDIAVEQQITKLGDICRSTQEQLKQYYSRCLTVSEKLVGEEKELFDATILLHTKIHWFCLQGLLSAEQACKDYFAEKYKTAFLAFGDAANWYDKAEQAMRKAEYGIWKDFYKNDCFADIKHTAYMLRKMMGVVREKGDNARHDQWYRDAVYPLEDRNIFTLLVNDSHMTEEELYQALKNSERENNKDEAACLTV